jgi:lysophospholipid acyltransferase (LPLAT)-like uncharacterized protein
MPHSEAEERRPPLRTRFLAALIWVIARLIGCTARVRYVEREIMDRALAAGTGAILVTWHGRSLMPANVLRNRDYWVLVSLSRDGDLQNEVFHRFGFRTIRGSTGRGGVRATLQLARILKDGGVLAFTPDGPRGPSRKVQLGAVVLAERSGCPVIPVGVSARPRVLVRSWDRYMVPAPFARVAWVVGEAITVPPGSDDSARQAAAQRIEEAINECERRAEEMLDLMSAGGPEA